MNQLLLCDNEKRRHLVREKETYNGLDYLEISPNQKVLTLYFLGKVPEGLTRNHFRISGGRRIRNIEIVDMWVCEQSDPELDNCVKLVVDKAG
ncbi:MAG: hypothetical protein KDE56_26930, partial [Anaerolineales bacterium]|nr:hypothetical protein [Anaerolineales bacterium]